MSHCCVVVVACLRNRRLGRACVLSWSHRQSGLDVRMHVHRGIVNVCDPRVMSESGYGRFRHRGIIRM